MEGLDFQSKTSLIEPQDFELGLYGWIQVTRCDLLDFKSKSNPRPWLPQAPKAPPVSAADIMFITGLVGDEFLGSRV